MSKIRPKIITEEEAKKICIKHCIKDKEDIEEIISFTIRNQLIQKHELEKQIKNFFIFEKQYQERQEIYKIEQERLKNRPFWKKIIFDKNNNIRLLEALLLLFVFIILLGLYDKG